MLEKAQQSFSSDAKFEQHWIFCPLISAPVEDNGVKPKSFKIGEAVSVETYSSNAQFKWTTGTVIERIGETMYNIRIKETRNSIVPDQILPRAPFDQPTNENHHQLPFEIRTSTSDVHLQQQAVQIEVPAQSSTIDNVSTVNGQQNTTNNNQFAARSS